MVLMGDPQEPESARDRVNRGVAEVRRAWTATPKDLFSTGKVIHGWSSEASLPSVLGYPDFSKLLITELATIPTDSLLCSALYYRLIAEGGYARPADDAQLELARALPYAVSHGHPPVKSAPPPPPPPPPPPEPPKPPEPAPPREPPRPRIDPPVSSPLLTPGRVAGALAVSAAIVLFWKLNSPPAEAPPPAWTPPVVDPIRQNPMAQTPAMMPAPSSDAGHPTRPEHIATTPARPPPRSTPSPPKPEPDPLGGAAKDLTQDQLDRILEKERRREHPQIVE
jgi:hypothetical protein